MIISVVKYYPSYLARLISREHQPPPTAPVLFRMVHALDPENENTPEFPNE